MLPESSLEGNTLAAGPESDRETKDATTSELVPLQAVLRASRHKELRAELDRVDPERDGWSAEAFSDRASRQLKRLSKVLQGHVAPSPHSYQGLVEQDFQCAPLRLNQESFAVDSESFRVVRGHQQGRHTDSSLYSGPAGLCTAIRELFAVTADEWRAVQSQFKIVRVSLGEKEHLTRVFVEFGYDSSDGPRQQTAIWNCRWNSDQPPLLRGIEIVRFEEVETAQRLFADATATVLGRNSSYRQHLVFGFDHWRQTLDWRFGMELAGPHGLTLGDVNGDDLVDVYFCETGGLPNRLLLQQPDGSARDVSAGSGTDYLEPTHSALLVDLDNDADQDLVLASSRYILMLSNDGTGRFHRESVHATMSIARSMAAADFDQDGDLDIYVCGYFSREATADGVGLGRPMPYHDANNGVRNYLLANVGNWQFKDVTDVVGLDQNNRRFSYAAAWEDYDNDGDQDLYVANDFGRNNLFRNDGGHFTDVAAAAGVEDISAGMSVSWGDFDRDGWMDLYVGNMFSSAGNRIAYQRRFQEAAVQQQRAQFQRHARGNSLFRNMGDGTFQDVSIPAGVTMGRWAWSSMFGDVNNDGWSDLLVGNGMVTSRNDPDDL